MGDAVPARAATPEGAEPDKQSRASLASTIAAPWFFSEVRYRWDMVDRRNINDANGEFVCMVQAPSHEPSARDLLIAAAPDMLRVLKEVAEGFGQHADVLAVINKAQGEN